MINKMYTERALVLLVIMAMLGSGFFYDAFGLEESEKVSSTDEDVGILKYERYLVGRYDLYSKSAGESAKFGFMLSQFSQRLASAGVNTNDAAKGTSLPKESGGGSLLEKATDPTAILTQFQIQNIFTPNTYNSKRYSNTTILQPVLPIPTRWESFPTQILKPKLPINVLTADRDGPIGETSGLGDLVVLDLFLPKRESWGTWGVRPITTNRICGFTRDGRLATEIRVLPDGADLHRWRAGGLFRNAKRTEWVQVHSTINSAAK